MGKDHRSRFGLVGTAGRVGPLELSTCRSGSLGRSPLFWRFSITASTISSHSLATILSPLATRHSPLPPKTLPRWLLPDTDRRIAKDRTGPDLDERSLYFSMSPNQAIRSDKGDSSPNSTAGRIRPGCHAHVFVSMECPGFPESLGHAHDDVSMAPKSLAQHHLRFISWSRGGDQ